MGFAHQGTVDPGQIEGDIPSSGVKKKDHDIEFDSKTMETTPLGPGYWATGATSHAAGGDSLCESSYEVLPNESSMDDAFAWKRCDGCSVYCTCQDDSSSYDCNVGDFATCVLGGVAAGKRLPPIDLSYLASTTTTSEQYCTLSTGFSMGQIVDGAKDTDFWVSAALADTNVSSTTAQHDRSHLIMPLPEGQTFTTVCPNLDSEV